MTRVEKAIGLHTAGSACSQAVFAVFAEDLGLDAAIAHKIAGGFGGGIGRMGMTCGAVTGGIMALSYALGASQPEDREKKLALYGVVSDYIEHLKAHRGSIECRELLEGADLWTQEGRDEVARKQLGVSVCNPLIEHAVREAERVLREQGKLGV